ncbi:MAG: purine-cytosine permease family protein, partial [Acidimicrobiales bacterium]
FTQIGFEVEGLILIVGAGLVLGIKAGIAPTTTQKALFVVGAVLIQGVLPVLGHATIVKTLRYLAVPFMVLFAVVLGFALPHATVHGVADGADWQTYLEGLAFTITLSGLGWTENGNDYSRYCRPDASKRSIMSWVFVGTALPEILIMLLGAAVGTFLTNVGKTANAFLPFAHQSAFPSWFVVVFLVFAILQLFAINSLDMYSSGVTLQAMGVRVKRYTAVVIDCVIALGVALYAIFDSSFGTYMKDFVDVVIVWIAPWCAIFLVDWTMRRFRYVPTELQRTDRDGLYYGVTGVSWPAVVAQVVGMYAALSALSATFSLPTWLNPITYYTHDKAGYGADFSVYLGMGAGGLLYLVLAWASVKRQRAREDELLARR